MNHAFIRIVRGKAAAPEAPVRPQPRRGSIAFKEQALALAWMSLESDPGAVDAAIASMGKAPKRPPRGAFKLGLGVGARLAELGLTESIQRLASLGWARILYPDGWNDQALGDLLSHGEPGMAAFEALMGAGAKAFSRDEEERDFGDLLFRLARRGDLGSLRRLLDQLAIERPASAREGRDLCHMVSGAFDGAHAPAVLASLGPADLTALARARQSVGDPQAGAAILALRHGGAGLDWARAIILAGPEAALAPVDPARAGFFVDSLPADPLPAIDLLSSLGVDFTKPSKDGSTPLHRAFERPGPIAPILRKLVGLGADPRARDSGGATPIGLAALSLDWAEIQGIFGAVPADLMDSQHSGPRPPGTRSPDDARVLPAPLRALAARRGPTPSSRELDRLHPANDLRLAELLRAAFLDPRSQGADFIEEGLLLCASQGLGACMEALVEHGARRGVRPATRHLLGAASQSPFSPLASSGRIRCLELAVQAGADPRGHCSDGRGDERGLIAYAAMEMKNWALSLREAEPCLGLHVGLIKRLIQWGCDPAEMASPSGRWSFGPGGAGRAALPPSARAAFAEIDSFIEARALDGLLSPAPSDAGPAGGLRI